MTSIDDFDSLNLSLIENLSQTLITLISAEEKLKELEKYKNIIKNVPSVAEKNEKIFNKIKTLLVGIQTGKQMLINRAKNLYSFENIDDLASNLTVNYKYSIDNLFSSSEATAANNVDPQDNKISSYLNIVTTEPSTIHHHPNNNNNNVKVSLCHRKNNAINYRNTIKTEITPKKFTNEYAEFDIHYPPAKIDIYYPRAKINICSETPQIDLKLPDPLIEYKSMYSTTADATTLQKQLSTITFTDTKTFKPTLHLDSIKTDTYTFKPTTAKATKTSNDSGISFEYNHPINNQKQTQAPGFSIKQSLTSVSQKYAASNKNTITQESENFVQAMIDKGCKTLLQELLFKYMSLDKDNTFDQLKKEKVYSQWLITNYSINEYDAARLYSYIETWYINCMMEKLELSDK